MLMEGFVSSIRKMVRQEFDNLMKDLIISLAQICGSIAAHARCINAIDCNEQGLIASVGDDCFVRIWKLSGDAENLQVNIYDRFCFIYVIFLDFS
jgi:hypothetical protein